MIEIVHFYSAILESGFDSVQFCTLPAIVCSVGLILPRYRASLARRSTILSEARKVWKNRRRRTTIGGERVTDGECRRICVRTTAQIDNIVTISARECISVGRIRATREDCQCARCMAAWRRRDAGFSTRPVRGG